MIWIFFAAIIFALALLALGFYGSAGIFHPGNMLPNEIWPEQYQIPYESVDFKTQDDLKLKGWIIQASQPTDKTVLLCHGWGDNKGDLFHNTNFLENNFNLFYFDFRSHGESEGKITTLGCLERFDIEAALDYLKKVHPSWSAHLGMFGHSMGTGPVTWAVEKFPDVKCAVLEAPMGSFKQSLTQWIANKYHLPYFPLSWAVYRVSRWRIGEDPEPYGPIYHIDKISPRPVFVIAAGHDNLMLPSTVRAVYERAKDPKTFWMVPGAHHYRPRCIDVAPIEYKQRVTEFFEKYL